MALIQSPQPRLKEFDDYIPRFARFRLPGIDDTLRKRAMVGPLPDVQIRVHPRLHQLRVCIDCFR